MLEPPRQYRTDVLGWANLRGPPGHIDVNIDLLLIAASVLTAAAIVSWVADNPATLMIFGLLTALWLTRSTVGGLGDTTS